MNKKLDHKATAGLFLGYGALTAVVYYYDKIRRQVKCAHHVQVNDLQIGGSDETPGSKLISKHATLHNIILPKSISTLKRIKTPFEYDQLFSYEVQLPQQGSLGLNMENDPVFGLPIINHMSENSPFKMGCKENLQKNALLVGIHMEEPITVEKLLDYIEILRYQDQLKVVVTLTKRVDSSATNYQMYRNYFDNFRPISAQAKLIIPEAKYDFQCPEKPIAP